MSDIRARRTAALAAAAKAKSEAKAPGLLTWRLADGCDWAPDSALAWAYRQCSLRFPACRGGLGGPVSEKINAVAGSGGMGWMMAGMLTQLPLPLLPAGAAEIVPGVGLVTGDDGGGLV